MRMGTSRQSGFILVVTLWMLAVITIGAAYFADRVATSVSLAARSQETTEALIELASTRAEILFRLGTVRVSNFGLGQTAQDAIALDNRPYRGSGQDIVRLQDSRGLINVNFVDATMLRRLLGQLGIPAENREALLDTLNDYTDTDDLRRLNGAESAEYRTRNLPPPPNDWLITPWQLQNIIGWREQPALWKDEKLQDVVSTARVLGFNPNTAPRDALAAFPGSSPELADKIIERRTLSPFNDVAELSALTGQTVIEPDNVVFFPGENIRLTLESDKIPWALRYQITLTPFGDSVPWRVDYYLKSGLTHSPPSANNPAIANSPNSQPAPLPKRATLPPTPNPTL